LKIEKVAAELLRRLLKNGLILQLVCRLSRHADLLSLLGLEGKCV